jgi:hypothetical protein
MMKKTLMLLGIVLLEAGYYFLSTLVVGLHLGIFNAIVLAVASIYIITHFFRSDFFLRHILLNLFVGGYLVVSLSATLAQVLTLVFIVETLRYFGGMFVRRQWEKMIIRQVIRDVAGAIIVLTVIRAIVSKLKAEGSNSDTQGHLFGNRLNRITPEGNSWN